MLKTTLIWMGFAWVVLIAAITIGFTMIAKHAGEREREHDLDERMVEE